LLNELNEELGLDIFTIQEGLVELMYVLVQFNLFELIELAFIGITFKAYVTLGAIISKQASKIIVGGTR
jgi:hypothetical protein